MAPVLSVQITPLIDKMRVGDTVTFSTRAEFGSGVPPSAGGFPQWSTTNRGVIIVDANGVVMAIGEGTATIEVTAHGHRVTRTIEVTP